MLQHLDISFTRKHTSMNMWKYARPSYSSAKPEYNLIKCCQQVAWLEGRYVITGGKNFNNWNVRIMLQRGLWIPQRARSEDNAEKTIEHLLKPCHCRVTFWGHVGKNYDRELLGLVSIMAPSSVPESQKWCWFSASEPGGAKAAVALKIRINTHDPEVAHVASGFENWNWEYKFISALILFCSNYILNFLKATMRSVTDDHPVTIQSSQSWRLSAPTRFSNNLIVK